MITQEQVNELKKKNTVLTLTTFKKSAVINADGTVDYKGKHYKGYTWLLTYLHKQYCMLNE